MWGWVAAGVGITTYLGLCYLLHRHDGAISRAKEEENRKCLERDLVVKIKLKRILQSLRQEREDELSALHRYKDKMQQREEKPDWPREGF